MKVTWARKLEQKPVIVTGCNEIDTPVVCSLTRRGSALAGSSCYGNDN